MSSGLGYPDWQKIQQWIGAPFDQATAAAIGAGAIALGPYNLASWASLVVAIKPTGGKITLTVKQQLNGGPATLELDEVFIVNAGSTLFEAVVLFGDVVSVTLQGDTVGETVDYAVYPSNTTTNAQVITNATINVQHNAALVAAEQTIDLEDNGTFVWSVADDAPNTRVKITPPQLDCVRIADTILGVDAASIDFTNIPQGYSALMVELYARSALGSFSDFLALRFNNDSAADYGGMVAFLNAAAPGAGTDQLLATSGAFGYIPGALATASMFGAHRLEIPYYANAANLKTAHAEGHHVRIWNSAANQQWTAGGVVWNSAAAISRLAILAQGGNLKAGTRATLYGLR